MALIHVLDERIANQIAAGEVVERPASVVKELVENSIDAGSSRIEVSIEEGGLQLIRVMDNGSGIAQDDCEAAFYRHATSKISSAKELFQIRTLGFRGEALPSISSVSKVICITSTEMNGLGSQIILAGGTVQSITETAAERGTDFQVRELFYNTPARLKYLKTVQTELGHVSDYIYRLALAHPKIAFKLQHNDNLMLQTLGNGDLLQVIAAIYGFAAVKQLIAVDAETIDYKVTGYISKPEWTRANRSGITTIINGRYIRNFALAQTVMHAYHTYLPINRFPVVILHIQMDPSLLDVNVHPAKLEVRFSKEPELLECITKAVAGSLQQVMHIPQISDRIPSKTEFIQERMEFNVRKSPNETYSDYNGKKLDEAQKVNEAQKVSEAQKISEAQTIYHAPKATVPIFPQLTPIGQLHGTYIAAQDESGFYLIDQHAAHERIHYEYYYDRFAHPAEASQQLLVPFTMDFTPSESASLQSKLHLFAQAGVTMECFGGQSFLVRAYPHWFPQGAEPKIIEEMAEWILTEKTAIDLAKLREKAAILCACKASIKANQSLTLAEMDALLQRLSQCNQPYTCPHGRPIVISFSAYELAKMFKRVM